MPTDIPESDYRAIEEQIASDQSPVGIDAKKTHVMILHKLVRIEARLAKLEAALERGEEQR
jgi:hypothetical protein